MELPFKEEIIKLFNDGDLGMENAQWYKEHGWSVVCQNGKVVDIIKEDEENVSC